MINVDQLLDELAQQRAGMSTTSLNLVAFVEGDADLLSRVTEHLDALAERNVSRTLLLTCDDREHRVWAHQVESGEIAVTHSEQIQLAVGGIGPEQLRSIVHDLLVPNVRTVLLWGGRTLNDARFTLLAQLADVVILSSSAFGEDTGPLREIVQLKGSEVEPKVRDLAYLRLLPWQDIIAQFFDDSELAAELPHISRVDVAAGSSPEAYYFVGWLASRLAWEPCGLHEFCNADGGAVSVSIEREGPPRRLASVRMRSQNCDFAATAQDESQNLIYLSVGGQKSRPARCVPMHDADIETLIENAIFSTHSGVYAETLDVIERLLQHER